MGMLSDFTIGKLNIDTKITPMDSLKEVFAKAFSSFFGSEKIEQRESLTITNNEVLISGRKVEFTSWEHEFLYRNYDESKYLGDSRASQCNPSEHIIRNMSPVELQNYINGEKVQPINGIEQVVLDGGKCFCFSPETPVYLGENLSSSHMRMGRLITPEIQQKIVEEKYGDMVGIGNGQLNIPIREFPRIENMQVVFAIKDINVYDYLETTCEGRNGIDPSFGYSMHEDRPFVADEYDNFDAEIRLPEYSQETLRVIAIEGINVEHFSQEEIEDLFVELLESRNYGIPADDFLNHYPEYESRYDTSHIVKEEEYIKHYEENGRTYFTTDFSEYDDVILIEQEKDISSEKNDDYILTREEWLKRCEEYNAKLPATIDIDT